MSTGTELYWLPKPPDWGASIRAALQPDAGPALFKELAGHQLDFIRTAQLDSAVRRRFPTGASELAPFGVLKLALLTSSTSVHLEPALRMAALRRGFGLEVYACGYGQYQQELMDPASPLHAFAPDIVLFALDARHVAGMDADAALWLPQLWRAARESFGCHVIQQTALPVYPTLLGSNEHRLAASRHTRIEAFNGALPALADEAGVDLLDLGDAVRRHGLGAWHDPVLWYKAKQEVHPTAAPLYGDMALRLIAARRGRSAKCLVMDLDNTIWGGVIGDDGLHGIVLGQGNVQGEAFAEFQRYAQDLARRGVILAVCSKNDEANALAPFAEHPEMVLKRTDIAAFAANWADKASNIRQLSKDLAIGLDAMVFVDDNPFERDLVRRELPMVAVPELPDDAAYYPACVSDAGYFDLTVITQEDRNRTALYQANAERAALQTSATDLQGYLKSLDMELEARAFDAANFQRILQLINKTNQFNLTTRRYQADELAALASDPQALSLQVRLKDRFGDNGVIAVIVAKPDEALAPGSYLIDTWLMSCRVLGRQVEQACLNVLADEAASRGARALIGTFRPSDRNQMVADHYGRLGFQPIGAAVEGERHWRLELDGFQPHPTHIALHKDIQLA